MAAQDTAAPKAVQTPWESAPRRNTLDHYTVIGFRLTTESAMKKIEGNIPVFTVAGRPMAQTGCEEVL